MQTGEEHEHACWQLRTCCFMSVCSIGGSWLGRKSRFCSQASAGVLLALQTLAEALVHLDFRPAAAWQRGRDVPRFALTICEQLLRQVRDVQPAVPWTLAGIRALRRVRAARSADADH